MQFFLEDSGLLKEIEAQGDVIIFGELFKMGHRDNKPEHSYFTILNQAAC